MQKIDKKHNYMKNNVIPHLLLREQKVLKIGIEKIFQTQRDF